MKQEPPKARIDLNPQGSKYSGFRGVFEATLRRFKVATRFVALIPLYGVAVVSMGLAASPGAFLFTWALHATDHWGRLPRVLALGPAAVASYFVYGFSLILVLPAINWVLRLKLKEWRGPYNSFEVLPWFVHNGLTYLARYTFLELITPTPFSIAFYRMMGMKIGQNSELNTTHISDPSLLSIGNKVTIGGSANICAHYASGGFLILAAVVIEDGATIGMNAIIMGGVRVGAKAKVMPGSFVLPKTQIPAGEVWGGIPAQRIDLHDERGSSGNAAA